MSVQCSFSDECNFILFILYVYFVFVCALNDNVNLLLDCEQLKTQFVCTSFAPVRVSLPVCNYSWALIIFQSSDRCLFFEIRTGMGYTNYNN